MINSAMLGYSFGSDVKNFSIFYGPHFYQDSFWDNVVDVLFDLFSNGRHLSSLDLQAEENYLNEVENKIIIQYNFLMPSSFYREMFDGMLGFLSSNIAAFDTIIITTHGDEIRFLFINSTNNIGQIFVLDNENIANDIDALFVLVSEANQPKRYVVEGFRIIPADSGLTFIGTDAINPIGSLQLTTVEPFISFFFPNHLQISSTIINNTFTYHDNFRMVKFYPTNFVEFSSLVSRTTQNANFTTSFLAALDMLNRDRNAMLANGSIMNVAFFVGYTHIAATSTWIFYFDYVVNGVRISLSSPFSYAIEIHVTNNQVEQYNRLMLNFGSFYEYRTN